VEDRWQQLPIIASLCGLMGIKGSKERASQDKVLEGNKIGGDKRKSLKETVISAGLITYGSNRLGKKKTE